MPLQRLKLVNTKPKQINARGWNKLISSIDKLAGQWEYGTVLGLDGWVTIQLKECTDYIFILAELSTGATCDCEVPGAKLEKHGMTRPMKVLDLPFRGKFTEIHYRIRRFRCTGCKKTIQQTVSGRHEKHYMTKRLVKYIERESLSIFKSFFDVSLETGVNPCVIRNVFTDHVHFLEKARVILTPRYLAIDENYLSTRKNVRCVITSPEEKTVLELLKDNSRITIASWLKQLPDRERVEVVSIDMCPAYISIIECYLPNAAIVIDRYHVQNLLNVELKSVLAVIRRSLTVTQHREIMRREKLLLKSRYFLSEIPKKKGLRILPPEKEQVDTWLNASPLLARAYKLKESFSDILQLNEREKAEERVDLWLEQLDEFIQDFQTQYKKECNKLEKCPFGSAAVSFRRYRCYILNYIDFKFKFSLKVTNGFAELANRKIKKAHAIGNGYNHEVLRAKLIHGGLLQKKMPPHPLDEPVSGKPSKGARKKSVGKTTKNPNANISRLRKARKDKDEMNTLNKKPQEDEKWESRFGSLESLDTSPGMINFGISDEDDKKPDLIIYNFDENDFSKHEKKKKMKKTQIDPPPLFQFFDGADNST